MRVPSISVQQHISEGSARRPASSNIVIANEKANWGSARLRIREATDSLRKQGFPFSLCTAEYPGHTKELAAAAAARKTATIIVVGGDGTINEVVNGLLAVKQEHLPTIGIVPAGSSNDFSKSLSIPQRVQEACQAILNGKTRDVDVGQAGTHYFCSASCLGYFAEVAAKSLRMTRFRGSLRYVIPAFSVIREMSAGWEMTLKTDERTLHGHYAVLLVGNAPRFGGLTMLPGAQPDDGVLDCLLIEMASKWEALQLIPLAYRKALERHKRATRFQTASLSVTLNHPSQVCDDGEMHPNPIQSIDYSVLPRRLRIIC
jgi:diacylglycerol kinase (ATP)